MVGLGLYTLAGGHIRLPSPGHRAAGGTGPLAVYTLGIFSGIATSCCAPVLAGVVALSGLSASLPAALGLGLAYVAGMVAPLFVMSLLWDGVGSRLGPFQGRRLTWRLGPIRRTLGAADLASGVLLLVMGAVSIWIALTGVPSPDGWQAPVAVALQAAGQAVTRQLAILPNWLAGLILALALLALGWWALAQVGLVRPGGPHALTPKRK